MATVGLGDLAEPAELVLTEFRSHQPAIIGWFVLLAAGAALLAPIAVRLGRLGGGSTMRPAVPVGIAAAALIAPGVAVPLGLPGADVANFVGYLLWSLWLVALAVRLVRAARAAAAGTEPSSLLRLTETVADRGCDRIAQERCLSTSDSTSCT